MSVKQFLYNIKDEQREIKIINDRIAELEAGLLPQGIRYDKEKVQTSPSGDIIADTFGEIDEYARRLNDIKILLSNRRAKALEMISKLEDSEERAVLVSFFLSENRKTMYQTSIDVGFSERETYRIYKSALDNLEKVN